MGIDFTADEARRQLQANGAMECICPACGNGRWEVGQLLTGMLPITDDDLLNLESSMAGRVVTVVCMDCGFVRFHDWQVLSD